MEGVLLKFGGVLPKLHLDSPEQSGLCLSQPSYRLLFFQSYLGGQRLHSGKMYSVRVRSHCMRQLAKPPFSVYRLRYSLLPAESSALSQVPLVRTTSSVTSSQDKPKPKKLSSEPPPEEVYQRLTQREHVLLRPEPYLGSMQSVTSQQWVWDENAQQIVSREISFVPALLQIFEEILVNAADNVHRGKGKKKMTYMRVTIDRANNVCTVTIDRANNICTVENDGAAIPITKHATEKIYIPELIFGHLLTSSNYDDSKERYGGGRHGYGAKLTNIFSSHFSVHIKDGTRGKEFKQEFTNNMLTQTEPRIEKAEKGSSFTRITFSPDLARFGLAGPSTPQDLVSLLRKRLVDIAACILDKGVTVEYNGKLIGLSDLSSYVNLYPHFQRVPAGGVVVGQPDSSHEQEQQTARHKENQEEMDVGEKEGKAGLVWEEAGKGWTVGLAVSRSRSHGVPFLAC
eukprot:g49991.t1